MKSVDSFPDGGLIVVRKGIDPVLAADFQQEWLGQLDLHYTDRLNGQIDGLQPVVFSESHSQDEILAKPSLRATEKVLEVLGLNNPDDDMLTVTINYQPTHAAQSFHKDNKSWDDTVVIVRGGSYGAFEYAPQAQTINDAETSHRTITLDAGDVVFQSNPYLFHRGRNIGEQSRITMALAKIDDSQFFEPSR